MCLYTGYEKSFARANKPVMCNCTHIVCAIVYQAKYMVSSAWWAWERKKWAERTHHAVSKLLLTMQVRISRAK